MKADKKPKQRKEKQKKDQTSSAGKRKQAAVLVPRPHIRVLEQDPFLESRFVHLQTFAIHAVAVLFCMMLSFADMH
jgi:hypothetical protein